MKRSWRSVRPATTDARQFGRDENANAPWLRGRLRARRQRYSAQQDPFDSSRCSARCDHYRRARSRVVWVNLQRGSAHGVCIRENPATKHGARSIARTRAHSPNGGAEEREQGAQGGAAAHNSCPASNRGGAEIPDGYNRALVLRPGRTVLRNRQQTGAVGQRTPPTTPGKRTSSTTVSSLCVRLLA